MGKFGRIKKNDPNSITFKLLSASQADPRVVACEGTRQHHILKRCDNNKHLSIPEDLLRALSPEDFGIHSNLTPTQRDALSLEVYGSRQLPFGMRLAAPAKDTTTTASSSASSLSLLLSQSPVVHDENDWFIDEIGEDDDDLEDAEELHRNFQSMNDANQLENKKVDNNQVDNKKVDNKDQEADCCYFPDDGYNYRSHLRSIGTGTYIAATKEPKKSEVIDAAALTDEGKAVLHALQSGGKLEPLDDDFVEQANFCEENDFELLLWGEAPVGGEDGMHDRYRSSGFPSGTESFANPKEGVEREAGTGDGAPAEDPRFLKIFAQYGDDAIGELASDDEAILQGSPAGVSDFHGIFADFLDGKECSSSDDDDFTQHQKQRFDDRELTPFPEPDLVTVKVTKALAEHSAMEPSATEESSSDSSSDEERQWDCETVLTTRTTLSNHPGRIKRPPSAAPSTIKFASKLQLPVEYLPAHLQRAAGVCPKIAPVAEEHSEENFDLVELPEVNFNRRRGETSEEKRARKQAVKETKRIVRQLKKKNDNVIKEESKKARETLAKKNACDLREGVRHFKY